MSTTVSYVHRVSTLISIGRVYRATDTVCRRQVAVKVEPCNFMINQLENEEEIYEQMKYAEGFPVVRWFGCENDINYLAMDLLGPSLQALFYMCARQFSFKTVVLIALQAVCSVPVIS